MEPVLKNLIDQDRRDLETLAENEGKEIGEVLRELVHEALTARREHGTLLKIGSGKLPRELSDPPPGKSPSGVLDALLVERAEGR